MGKHLDRICRSFSLEELDAGDFRTLRISGMTFRIRGFHAQGLGHVSSMTASGFFGLIKMETLIINPFEKDMPLLSYDRIHAMGKDSLYLELYNTMLGETDLSPLNEAVHACRQLPSFDPGSHWYDSIRLPQSLFKRGKTAHSAAFGAAAERFLDSYLSICSTAPLCDPSLKKEKAAAYSRGLLENGGPAVDVFVKKLGRDTTARLFASVLFGV